MPTTFTSVSRAVATLVEIVFTDGTTPTTFRFSDTPYFDSSSGSVVVYEHTIIDLGVTDLSRISGAALTGRSTPDAGKIRIAANAQLREALDGLSCRKQSLIVRKGDPASPVSSFSITFKGTADNAEFIGNELVITPFGLGKLFETEFQPNTWDGFGRPIVVSSTGYAAVTPAASSTWSWTTAGTLEFGYRYGGSLDPLYGVIGRTDIFSIRITSSGKIEARLRNTANTAWQATLTGATTLVNGTRYHIAIRWTGTVFDLVLDGVVDATAAATGAPPTSTTDLTIGKYNVSNIQAGEFDRTRIWKNVARTDAQLLENHATELDSTDTTGLVLDLSMEEGLGNKVYDNVSGQTGTLYGDAHWGPAVTGMKSMRGQRKPWTFGVRDNVDPVLIDPIGQVYAVNFGGVSTIAPMIGGRYLSIDITDYVGGVTFTASRREMNYDTGILGSYFFDNAKAFWRARVSGTSNNDGDYTLARDPFRDSVTNNVVLRFLESVVDETIADPSGVGLSTVTVSINRVEETATGDFSATNKNFTTTTSGDLSSFDPYRSVLITGASSANDGLVFFVVGLPYQNASGKWVIEFSEAPTAETGKTVTFLQNDEGPEYTADVSRGQFTLSFEPTKPITAKSTTSSGFVGTVLEDILSGAGSTETQSLPVDSDHLDEFTTLVGIYGKGGTGKTAMSSILDQFAAGLFLQWVVKARDGEVDLAQVPPDASYLIDVVLNAQDRVFSIKRIRYADAPRYVEVRYGHNDRVLSVEELDGPLQSSRNRAQMERVRFLTNEWQSVRYPKTGGDEALDPLILDSPIPLDYKSQARALAKSVYDTLSGGAPFYEVETDIVFQDLDPWRLRVLVTDDEDPYLAAGRYGYVVESKETGTGTTLVVMFLGE